MYIYIPPSFSLSHLQSVELDPSSLWEDEDSHQFYAGVTDIKPFVPAILFQGKKKSESESSDVPSEGETETSGDTQTEQEEEGVSMQCFQLSTTPLIWVK